MKNYNISIIKGDGIGPEIVDEAIKVLNAAAKKCDFELNYK
ncbi:MAG: isocitrate/isopropylmalate family dehydrogenase, partial [Arcobacter sp.]